MKLKICGVNEEAFACAAAQAGADYLGFIFEPTSPRGVTPEQAERIVRRVRMCAYVPRCVGVFVKQTVAEIRATLREMGLDVAQLHRRATVEDVAILRKAGYEVWTLAGGTPGDGVLFDSSHGDGETIFRRGSWKTILAGGISCGNLAEALKIKPDIVDVSGSLESACGVKSIVRLRQFMSLWNRR